MQEEVTPELLLRAYASGYFPMAESADDSEIYWFRPEMRAILPLGEMHIPGNLKKKVNSQLFHVTFNATFREVIYACAAPRPDRPDTWINSRIISLYTALHEMEHAHSVECWLDGVLVGGLYGVSIGGAFFGESMFSRVTDASKVALVHLVQCLNAQAFTLLDVQYTNNHLKQFGIVEIPDVEYRKKLEYALRQPVHFGAELPSESDTNAQ